MTRRLLVCPVLLLAVQLAGYGDDETGKRPAGPTNSGLEKMKKLAGTWLAADKDGKPTDQVVSIRTEERTMLEFNGKTRKHGPGGPISRARSNGVLMPATE